MMEKEESDSTPFRRQQQIALQRILNLAEDRDAGQPFQVIDSERMIDDTSA